MSILAELATGEALSGFQAQNEEFLRLMHGMGKVEPDEVLLGDATALAGVAQLPMRVKCALLGWMAVTDAVGRSLAAPITEGEQS
jgi:nitrogen fixation protein NifU and related proteins